MGNLAMRIREHVEIEKSVYITVPIERVWSALTDARALESWMDDTAQLELRAGGRYQFFGGETTGTFIIVERPDRLEYTWRQRDWPQEWADSVVRWELQPERRGTRLYLTHTQIPSEEERASQDEAWDLYVLEPLKDWLEGDG
jgi:uncharacterized protein YndB with AHSA1/START domain